jgi:hypothetical protein
MSDIEHTKSCQQPRANSLVFQSFRGFKKGMALAEKCGRGGIEQVNYSSRKIGGYLMAVFMLLAIASIASTTAQAQYPGGYGQQQRYPDDRYRNDRYRNDRNGYNNAYQIAREQGYRNGLSTGASDAQRGQSYNPQRSHFWRNGTDGYSGSYGNRGQTKQVFRDAFVQGYREGYQRYGGYNNRRGNNGRWGNGRWPY